ncbi:TonB-dependent siderophore receptor [Chlorogloeopsis sp. ULAP01]|uniref:TonB-dependent siderophore receptor n=1 Tax=Chlorogloeopsis sp. ULAP01 TaxID=3056483 RepID=UPI0025AACD85|nr:TonB-dependent siderophore receptor [Chlorogloeopsis sp. ULAP01]MDM9382405.1 TonB-dependent siderophore receptor [Chlorogloeopsis sp. ULAP01]
MSAFSVIFTTSVNAEITQNNSASKILNKSEFIQFAKTIEEWLVQSSNPSQSPIIITGIRIQESQNGIDIILDTQKGEKLQTVSRNEGNNVIIDIKNAQLRLEKSNTFRQEKPLTGITAVEVKNSDANSITLTVAGETTLPKVELFDDDEGLIFEVTSATTATQPQPESEPQPSESPQAENVEEQEPIELVVTGEQDSYLVPETSSATRTDTPLRDIPQSIQIVPKEVIQEQRITRISDAVRNVSSVSPRTEFSGSYDVFTIRGFTDYNLLRNGTKTQNFFIDGSNIEQVEVLKGPASVLYGQFEPGGIVNLVTKKPLINPYYAAEFTAGSYDYFRPAIDISGPLTPDKSLLYRLNVAYESAGSFRDFIDSEVFSITPALTFNFGDATTVGVEYEYVNTDRAFDRGLRPQDFLFDLPISRNLGDKNDRFKYEGHRLNLLLDHNFNQNLQLKSNFTYQLLSPDAEYVNPSDDFEADGRSLLRDYVISPARPSKDLTLQTDLISKFKTGSIEHQLVLGLDLSRNTFNYAQSQTTNFPSLDIFNPVYGFPRPDFFESVEEYESQTDTIGVYLQDQIALIPNFKLLLGGRYDFVNFKSTFIPDIVNDSPSETSKFYDEAFSPRVGIVYQLIKPISLYASYSTSFVPNNNNATADGEPLEPTRGTQYEIGVKAELFDGKLSTTLAAYDITKTNVATVDPNDDNFSIAVGEVKSRGIELDIVGEITPGWKIIASGYLNDAFVSEDNSIPTGTRLENAAYNGASLWTTYEFQKGSLQGLALSAGLFYVGDRIANQSDPFTIPSYVRTDAAIAYRRDNWQAAINFKNIFNTRYYDTNGYLIFPQAPFTVLGTLSVSF